MRQQEVVWTPENSLVKIAPISVEDFGSKESLLESIDQSLRYLDKLDPEKTYQFGEEQVGVPRVRATLIDFREKVVDLGLGSKLSDYLESNYDFFSSAAQDVLFTGYFEASLFGARKPDKIFNYPLYQVPDDMLRIDLNQFFDTKQFAGIPTDLRARITDQDKLFPYYSRQEIDSNGALAGRDLELVWVDDPIAAFFLHIQGSGIVYFEDGTSLRVNYADKNGQPYRALGNLFIKEQILPREEISMRSLVSFLRENPDRVTEMLNYNPSYIFFRSVDEGPIGSIGVPLTPMRSIATDYRIFPRGALAFIRTRLPDYNGGKEIESWQDFSAFVLNQDTGGAIRGANRVDLFTGHGDESEDLAGPLKESGQLIFLLKR